jgi:histidinol-phosphate/aromatic aminotransferase/cobyric acid decarboxylase-like protein
VTLERIRENVLIDAIDAVIAEYRICHGREPLNVSHWDPSPDFIQRLGSYLPDDSAIDPVTYRYSYMIEEERRQIAGKLGFGTNSAVLVTENGSMSILAAAHWLAARGVTEVRLMMPAYFITSYSLRSFGMKVNEMPLHREGGRYSWPKSIDLRPNEALWVTNPVYNTGYYFLEESAAALATMVANGKTAVVDEALAFTPTTFARECQGTRGFLGIYTPHKAVCLNTFKFSALVFHPDFETFFDDWADIFFGGLSRSSVAATHHFTSGDYDTYLAKFITLIDDARRWHRNLLDKFGGRIETDNATRGHFMSVYFPELAGELGNSLPFIKETIDACGTAFIPGQRSGFPTDVGFCFRINLAQDSVRFRGSLHRLYAQLTQ